MNINHEQSWCLNVQCAQLESTPLETFRGMSEFGRYPLLFSTRYILSDTLSTYKEIPLRYRSKSPGIERRWRRGWGFYMTHGSSPHIKIIKKTHFWNINCFLYTKSNIKIEIELQEWKKNTISGKYPAHGPSNIANGHQPDGSISTYVLRLFVNN